MELFLKRTILSKNSTIGTLSCLRDDRPVQNLCLILEDVDRGLASTMSPTTIAKLKVHGKTAIPRGRYQIVVTMSNRFKRELPLLLNVPGYEGVRIHPGNTAADTEGCLLPGVNSPQADFVNQSRIAFDLVNTTIHAGLNRGEEVWITIE